MKETTFLFLILIVVTSCSPRISNDVFTKGDLKTIAKIMEKGVWTIDAVSPTDPTIYKANLSRENDRTLEGRCLENISSNYHSVSKFVNINVIDNQSDLTKIHIAFLNIPTCFEDIPSIVSDIDSFLIPAMEDTAIMSAFNGLQGQSYKGNPKEFLDNNLPKYALTIGKFIDLINAHKFLSIQLDEDYQGNTIELKITSSEIQEGIIRGRMEDYSYGELQVYDVTIQ